jgi:hypothetical protein
VQVIDGNPTKAQATKGKSRTSIFNQLKAAGFPPCRIIEWPDGRREYFFGAEVVDADHDADEWDRALGGDEIS